LSLISGAAMFECERTDGTPLTALEQEIANSMARHMARKVMERAIKNYYESGPQIPPERNRAIWDACCREVWADVKADTDG